MKLGSKLLRAQAAAAAVAATGSKKRQKSISVEIRPSRQFLES